MNSLTLFSEIVGHTSSIAAFIVVVVYVIRRRRWLRRTMRKALVLYQLILISSAVLVVFNVVRLIYLLTRGMDVFAPFLDLVTEYPSVIGQSLIIIALIGLRVMTNDRSDQARRVLAIGAHPDDLEIACGGTLAQFHDAGCVIQGIIMTQGEQGGDSATRPQEAKKGADFLGLDQLCQFDFPDTRLREKPVEMLAGIETVMRDFKPDMILTHSSHDIHQDHQAVHEVSLRAARNTSMVLCYESPSVTTEFVPTVFVDIGPYLDVKIESIREHWDQRGKPYVQAERVRGQAIFRGGQAKTRYAEGFEVIRALYSKMGPT